MIFSIAALLRLLLVLTVSTVALVLIVKSITRETRRWKQRKPQIIGFIEQRLRQKITYETFVIVLPESMDIRESYIAWFAFTKDYAAYCIKEQATHDEKDVNVFLCKKRDIELKEIKVSRGGWRSFQFKARAMDDPNTVHTLMLHLKEKRYNLFVENAIKKTFSRL